MKRSIALVALAIAGFALGLQGCGDDKSGGSAPTGTTSVGSFPTATGTGGTTTDDNGGTGETETEPGRGGSGNG